MQPSRILIVEDDPGLRSTLTRAISAIDMQAFAVSDGRSAMRELTANAPFQVVVLDIGLPDADGRDVCQSMRANGIPGLVLFLTARGQLDDELSGFAAGGDDFLTKPFHLPVLQARVRSLARRAISTSQIGQEKIHLDPGAHCIIANGISISLSPTEFRILATLLGAPDRVHRRSELLIAGWPAGAQVHDQTLDQFVSRIRRKLAQIPDGPQVTTVHGVGYQLQEKRG
jgi:DNA-binding response OmpR family regulator